jgi:hypothetical protein
MDTVMNVLKKFRFAIIATTLLLFGTAIAQDDRDDETEVWIAVEAQWDANENGDKNWIDRMLMDGFYGWD